MKKIALTIFCISLYIFSSAQCNANFTYSVTAGSNVSFTDVSASTSALNYYWIFGDGSGFPGATLPSPVHTYSANGTYTVTLAISTPSASCSSTITQVISVSNAACTLALTPSFSFTTGANGLVNFTDLSTGTTTNTLYHWNFGDGNNSALVNPSNTYASAGNYSVMLTLADGACVSNTTLQVVPNTSTCNLAASFSHTTGSAGSVNFSSTATNTTANTSYYWHFGDGTSGSGSTTNHSYTNNGTYTVWHSVVDSIGGYCMDSTSAAVTITNVPCPISAGFSLVKDTTMAFTWSVIPTYPPNITAAYWSWGDGNGSLGLYPSYTYSAAGVYTICLTATVSCGASTMVCQSSNIYKTSSSQAMISITVVNGSTDIKESYENSSFSIFPNPSDGRFNLHLDHQNLEDKKAEMIIFNILGEVIYRNEKEIRDGSLSENIGLNEVANGTYFVQVITENKVYTRKIVVAK